ncbi:LysR family transcriptional regulator [Chitinivorax sp. PXF-14]|uniref:LysR family transcriptional regulator n=1 Tax=Chitinivorax sp. PXF-14 TaxID=3230488 RepID=UPI00346711D7
MRLSLDALLVLDAIDRKGSFAAAADELYRVPSAVTYAVQKLEQDLDVTIFDRSGHRAKLTPAGEELLREGRHLLDAANLLECRVKRIATGWETDLKIAVSDLIDMSCLYPLMAAFDAAGGASRIKLMTEVFGGTWDALVSTRADIAIGAMEDGPPGGGYSVRPMGEVEFVFAVAPSHPLASAQQPLPPELVRHYRAVSAADSSRALSPRTSGLLTGQDVLTVSDIRQKAEAQAAGLGVGFLPRGLAQRYVDEGRLRVLDVQEAKPVAQLNLAWRARQPGKALHWFIRHLSDDATLQQLLQGLR